MSVITEIMLDTMELLSLVMSWPRERLSENDRDPASHVVTWGSMEEHALQVARVAVYGRGMRFQADPPDGKVIAAPPGALEQIGSKKEADLTQWRYDPVIRARWWFRRILRPDHSGGHIVGRESIFRVVVEEKTVGPTLEETEMNKVLMQPLPRLKFWDAAGVSHEGELIGSTFEPHRYVVKTEDEIWYLDAGFTPIMRAIVTLPVAQTGGDVPTFHALPDRRELTMEETGKLMREKLEAAREKARLDHLRSFENIALKSTE